MSLLKIDDVQFSYHTAPVLKEFSLELFKGEIACLLGPSGCGKSTALRCIAGFERLADGQIHIHSSLVANVETHVPPEKRKVGVVFQDYALFPHLNVRDNIAFGLEFKSRQELRRRIQELVCIVGLEGEEEKFPSELSGGQQQRVALARALAPEPELILLDEPFSNLDPSLRLRLKKELRRILKKVGATALIVTHDQHEAFDLADKIGVMKNGRILQWNTAYNLYHAPCDRFVASFVGRHVFVPGKLLSLNPAIAECVFGQFPATLVGQGLFEGDSLDILLRPDNVVHDETSPLKAEVLGMTFRGIYNIFDLRLTDQFEVLFMAPSHQQHAVGSFIGIRLDLNKVVVFKKA